MLVVNSELEPIMAKKMMILLVFIKFVEGQLMAGIA